MSMEARMSLCNMSIELGARGGLIAPDITTYNYIKGRRFAPSGTEFDKAVKNWKNLYTDEYAVFDKEFSFDASLVKPMITFGTNPGMAISIESNIPIEPEHQVSKSDYLKAIDYMDFEPGQKLLGKKVNYIFVGSCTNGRIEDLRQFATMVKGRKKAENITAWIVPGSKLVEAQAIKEGIRDVLKKSGFELRQPGCSACLAMNDDKIPSGEYCVATTNRNFEGRQGPGARTILASPLTAAAAAISGEITDPRTLLI